MEENFISPSPSKSTVPGPLAQEYNKWRSLFGSQPTLVQRFLEAQGGRLANHLTDGSSSVKFSLPDQVVITLPGQETPTPQQIPHEQRDHSAGGLVQRFMKQEMGDLVTQRFDELEANPDITVSTAGGLLRFATAYYMIHTLLPSGRSVVYQALDGEEIPSIPTVTSLEPESAITAATDAIAEEAQEDEGRGELLVPYVPAARRFYLPQWVAFDDQDHLLVNSVGEAEAYVNSMERFLDVLHAAVTLAPFIVVDQEYQQKRYGMLGQLINQGRALARHETREIVAIIHRRAANQALNRGLSISLPYYDDQDLMMKTHTVDAIPAGRVMFVPAFVVLASQREQAKVAQDTRLSASTRTHMIAGLRILETAFTTTD